MDKNGFRIFLQEKYLGERSKKPLSKKSISDILSRCKKVERDLEVNLDDLVTDKAKLSDVENYIREKVGLIEYKGKRKYFYRPYITAVRVYFFYKKTFK